MIVRNIRNSTKFRQTVLLIDDQPTVLDIHTAILKSLKMNLKIVAMTDPMEALQWIKNKQVDLIITDYRMHKMNGMQFVEAIQSASGESLHPIIVVTVIKNKIIHQELLNAGATACLTKPAQTEELAEIAKNLLAESQQRYGLTQMN